MWTAENRGRYDHRKLRTPSDLTGSVRPRASGRDLAGEGLVA
jgi:hypothetical protein